MSQCGARVWSIGACRATPREYQASARHDAQTNRGRIFELLADLTDEDGAYTEMEDLPHWLLDEDEDEGMR